MTTMAKTGFSSLISPDLAIGIAKLNMLAGQNLSLDPKIYVSVSVAKKPVHIAVCYL